MYLVHVQNASLLILPPETSAQGYAGLTDWCGVFPGSERTDKMPDWPFRAEVYVLEGGEGIPWGASPKFNVGERVSYVSNKTGKIHTGTIVPSRQEHIAESRRLRIPEWVTAKVGFRPLSRYVLMLDTVRHVYGAGLYAYDLKFAEGEGPGHPVTIAEARLTKVSE